MEVPSEIGALAGWIIGVLITVIGILGTVIVFLDKRLAAERAKHEAAIDRISEAHRRELRESDDRIDELNQWARDQFSQASQAIAHMGRSLDALSGTVSSSNAANHQKTDAFLNDLKTQITLLMNMKMFTGERGDGGALRQ